MKNILLDQFAIEAIEIKKLNGYENANYLVKSETGKFIFKTYPASDDLLSMVKAENEALIHLHSQTNSPVPVPFVDGSYVKLLKIEGEERICRMLTFIEGDLLGDVPHTKSLFRSLGAFIAKLDLQLQNFTNYTIKARQWKWDIQYLHLNNKYL